MKRFLKYAVIVIVVAGITTGAYLWFEAQNVAAQTLSDLPTATCAAWHPGRATVNAAGNIAPAEQPTPPSEQSGQA